MKKIRIFACVVLSLLLVLSLTACGSEEEGLVPEEVEPGELPQEEAPAEEAPAEEAPAEEAPAPDPVYGHSVAEADGILELDALKAGYEALQAATDSSQGGGRPSYEEVKEIFGVHGMKSEGHWSEDYHAYFWSIADGKAKVLVSFKVQPDGSETWASSSWSDNLS